MSNKRSDGGNLPLTDEQQRVADNIKAVWLEFKFKTGWSQADMAKKLGFKGQSGFNQYLMGNIAPNRDFVEKFAKVVGVQPGEIWPEKYRTGTDRIEWTEQQRIAHKLELLDNSQLNLIDQMIDNLSKKK